MRVKFSAELTQQPWVELVAAYTRKFSAEFTQQPWVELVAAYSIRQFSAELTQQPWVELVAAYSTRQFSAELTHAAAMGGAGGCIHVSSVLSSHCSHGWSWWLHTRQQVRSSYSSTST